MNRALALDARKKTYASNGGGKTSRASSSLRQTPLRRIVRASAMMARMRRLASFKDSPSPRIFETQLRSASLVDAGVWIEGDIGAKTVAGGKAWALADKNDDQRVPCRAAISSPKATRAWSATTGGAKEKFGAARSILHSIAACAWTAAAESPSAMTMVASWEPRARACAEFRVRRRPRSGLCRKTARSGAWLSTSTGLPGGKPGEREGARRERPRPHRGRGHARVRIRASGALADRRPRGQARCGPVSPGADNPRNLRAAGSSRGRREQTRGASIKAWPHPRPRDP